MKGFHFLCSILCLPLASPLAAKPLSVVTTTTDLASVARSVGGDQVVVESLAVGLQNPHFVEAKPSLIVKLMKADLFVQTGLELEVGWAPVLLQGARNPKILKGSPGFFDASAAVHPIEIPQDPSRAMGDVHPGGNPHYMADPENGRRVARALAKRLGELAPDHEGDFQANLESFEKSLDQKIAAWKAALAPFKGAKFVSYHRDWNYFAQAFGLSPAGEIEPKPGIPPTAAHTSELIERMKAEKVKVVFCDPWYERRTPEFIARQTGAKLLDMTLYPGGAPDAEDYLSAMDRNVSLLAESLQ